MVDGPARALLGFSVALGVLKVADGFPLELPWTAWAYALLLLGGSAWLWRRDSRGAVVLLGALHLLELLMLVLVFRTAAQAPPTWLWWIFVVLPAGGTASAAWALTASRTPLAVPRSTG